MPGYKGDLVAKAVLNTSEFDASLAQMKQSATAAGKDISKAGGKPQWVQNANQLTKDFKQLGRVMKIGLAAEGGIELASALTKIWKGDILGAQAALEGLPFGVGKIIKGVHDLRMEWSGVGEAIKKDELSVKNFNAINEIAMKSSKEFADAKVATQASTTKTSRRLADLFLPDSAEKSTAKATGDTREEIEAMKKKRRELQLTLRAEEQKASLALREIPRQTDKEVRVPSRFGKKATVTTVTINNPVWASANARYEKMQNEHKKTLAETDKQIMLSEQYVFAQRIAGAKNQVIEWVGVQAKGVGLKASIYTEDARQQTEMAYKEMVKAREQKKAISEINAQDAAERLHAQGRDADASVAMIHEEYRQRIEAAKQGGMTELANRLKISEKQHVEMVRTEDAQRKNRENAQLRADIDARKLEASGQTVAAERARIKAKYSAEMADALKSGNTQKLSLLKESMAQDLRDATTNARDGRGSAMQTEAGRMSFAGGGADKALNLSDATIAQFAQACMDAAANMNRMVA